MQLMLLPCYEGESYDGDLSSFHPLHGEMSEAAMLQFLIALSRYGDRDFTSTEPTEIVARLMRREDAVIGGGLVAVKGDYRLFPGCCCGLESWRDWQGLRPLSQNAVWLGHDPNAWVDSTGPKAVLHNDQSKGLEALEVDYAEIEAAAHQAGIDLEEFMLALELWLTGLNIADAEAVCAKITNWFWIGPAGAIRAAGN